MFAPILNVLLSSICQLQIPPAPLPPTISIPRPIHEPQNVKDIPVVKPTR